MNSKNAVFEAYKTAFEQHGCSLSKEYFLKYMWGKPWAPEDAILLNIGPHLMKAIQQSKYLAMLQHELEVSTTLTDILRYMESGARVEFVSSGSYEASRWKLRQSYFKTHPCVSSVNKRNADFWEIFTYSFFETYGSRACVMVFDDDPEVIAAAKSVGCRTVLWTEFQ